MASERKSARQARVIKKEPTYAVAGGAAGAGSQAEDAPERWIAIDLAKALPGISITDSMQIILEGVPDGARLSAGRNNGDKTWSLSPEDLIGLGYLPPPGRSADGQSVLVRLITYDPDGYQIASTTAQVAVDVHGVTVSRAVRLGGAEGEGALDAIREIEISRRLAAAEQAWRAAEAERIATLEAAWHAASEEQLKAAQEKWQQGEANRAQGLRDEVADMARRLREAEAEWHREESERISAALAQAADFTAQRFAAAEAQWQAEAERRLAEVDRTWQQEVEARAAQAARGRADADTEIAAEFERRMAAEVAAVEKALRAELEGALSTAQAESDQKLRAQREQIEATAAAARDSELEHAQRELARLEGELVRMQAEAEASRLAFQRESDERQQSWEMERTAIIAAAATDPADPDRMAAIEERWRLEADRLVSQAEARVGREAERRLAEAEASWREIGDRRLAEAEQQSSQIAERRISELHAGMAAETEERLAVMRRRMSEVERLAAEADRHIADRERQLAEAVAAQQELERRLEETAAAMRDEQERGAAEMHRRLGQAEAQWKAAETERLAAAEAAWRAAEAAETERVAAAEAAWRAAEADRIAEAQALWRAGEAERLANAEVAWRGGEQDRLADAIAAERVLLVGADISEILAQAEARWREEERERMAAAESRWRMEEDQRVGAAVAAGGAELERLVEARLHRELALDARRLLGKAGRGPSLFAGILRWCVAAAMAALVATVALVFAPKIKALIPEPAEAVAEVSAPWNAAGSEPAGTPSLVVSGLIGLLRAEPSSSSPIIARLQRGTPLIALDRHNGWIKVASADHRVEGWIYSTLLEGTLPPLK